MARGAERELVLLGSQKIPVKWILAIEADAAVDVLRGAHDAMPRLRGDELRHRDLALRVAALVEQPRGPKYREPDRLDVHVSVRRALCDGLEGADRTVELLSFGG